MPWTPRAPSSLCALGLALGLSACKPAPTEPAAPSPAAAPEATSDDSRPAKSESALDPLMHPELATRRAPDEFEVRFETTRGDFLVAVHRDWAPLAADRFFNLVEAGYYQEVAFYRAVPNFMVQFGVHGDPFVTQKWNDAPIPDEPATHSNLTGTIAFAKSKAPNSRTAQLFINTVDNQFLDELEFAPFGEVHTGMYTVLSLYTGYGECAPMGEGPNQRRFTDEGNPYLSDFPRLDYIQTATVVSSPH
ncbi:MAG: peptidylprolyl isomerase [Myxococcota bacterium]